MTTIRGVRRILATVMMCALALVALGSSPAAATSGDWPAHPDVDPFYAQPDPMPDARPGTILDSREVTIRAAGIPIPLRAWHVKYLSKDVKGRTIADVATIMQAKDAAPTGRLVSYQTAQDGLSMDCAPSYVLRTGLELPAEELALMVPALRAGHTVVTADYEGPRSAYGPGILEGRGVLDGIRAAQTFGPAGLDGTATPTALMGYSGGALASAWANELQPSYAPELSLAGVAMGGVPVDFGNIMRRIDGGPFSGLGFGAIVGIQREYPEIDPDAFLNERGKRLWEDIQDKCVREITSYFAFRRLDDHTKEPGLLDRPEIKAIIDENRLGGRTPRTPTYVYEAVLDEIIPIRDVDGLVRMYCGNGVPVKYRRYLLGEHGSVAVTGAPGAIKYLNDRLAGRPAPSTC